jgi:hypothetical protein
LAVEAVPAEAVEAVVDPAEVPDDGVVLVTCAVVVADAAR